MNKLNVSNVILAFCLYIHIHDDGKCQVEAREHYEGLGSILTSEEDLDIRLPINQGPIQKPTEMETFSKENSKPRNFLFKKRESKKLTKEKLKSIKRSKRRKKRMKKDKKMADVEVREHYEGLESILTSPEDVDIRLPLNQETNYETTETEAKENTKLRKFRIKRRESKKFTKEKLKSIRGSKRRKKRKKKDKMADFQFETREGLGSPLTSQEDIDIRLPINQVPNCETTKEKFKEEEKTKEVFDDEYAKPRNFLIKRRESKKLTREELKSPWSKKRKKCKKKDKKMANARTFVKDFQNQTEQNKVKPFNFVINIKVNNE